MIEVTDELGDRHLKIGTGEDYSESDARGQYLRAFDDDGKEHTLTLLVRNDRYGDGDRMEYHAGAVAISREDALELARWINERFGEE